jgi:hypothetical protein
MLAGFAAGALRSQTPAEPAAVEATPPPQRSTASVDRRAPSEPEEEADVEPGEVAAAAFLLFPLLGSLGPSDAQFD